MIKYIFRRICMVIPVIIGVTLFVFIIMDMSPGDPARMILGDNASLEALEILREEMGLNDPLLVRYGKYMLGMLRGDLGVSYRNQLDVASQIAVRLPNTILLAFSAMIVALVIGIPAGIISAKKQYTWLDNFFAVFALIGQAAPTFWLGLMLVIVFSLNLRWFPSSGMKSGFFGTLQSLALPALSVGYSTAAVVTRMTRSSMLEVINQEYNDTARAKGLKESVITFKHMLKNALIPIITVVGLQVGFLLSGSVVTESIFSWPGLGRYMLDSIKTKDIPPVLGSVIVLSIVFTIVNLLVDLLYAFVDPRIKSQYKSN